MMNSMTDKTSVKIVWNLEFDLFSVRRVARIRIGVGLGEGLG